ncbi:MAG: hypothetical protein ACFUZC_03895 [Chthoniobacteraceae bacterium]
MSAQEEIMKLQQQVENLRHRAILELKVQLAEARNHVAEIGRKLAELTGGANSANARVPRKPRVSVTIKQIVEAIQGGATNYRTVADKLGCSPANVAKKIKEEGKKAGIRSKGEKANFVLSVK